MNQLKLLLIGATVLQLDNAGRLTAKRLVVDYIQEFAQWFDKVVWVTSFVEEKAHTQAVIDRNKVTPCIVKAKARGWLFDYLTLQRLIDRQTVIFLHLPNVWLAPIVLALRRRVKGLFVYVSNDYVQHSEISRQTRGWLYSRLYRLAHELPINFADGVVVRGRLNFERVGRLNRNVIETIPIGLNTVLQDRTKEACSGNLINILYVGKLVEGKGVEVLLQAFYNLCKNLSDKKLLLTIVGTGSQEENLKRMFPNLVKNEKVKFLGFVDDKHLLSQLYAEADIVVVPSTYPEGVPRVIDEALIHKTPVIVSDLEGIRRQFSGREVVRVPPGDVAALSDAMYRLIVNPCLRRKVMEAINKRSAETSKCRSASEQHARFIFGIVEKRSTTDNFRA